MGKPAAVRVDEKLGLSKKQVGALWGFNGRNT